MPESTSPETRVAAPRDRTKYKKRDHVDLRALDPNSQAYWNEVLRREGLSMSRGMSCRELVVGSSSDLQRLVDGGKVVRKGKSRIGHVAPSNAQIDGLKKSDDCCD